MFKKKMEKFNMKATKKIICNCNLKGGDFWDPLAYLWSLGSVDGKLGYLVGIS